MILMSPDLEENTPVLTNVALGRPTAQSSVGWGGVAARAVDGNTNKQWRG